MQDGQITSTNEPGQGFLMKDITMTNAPKAGVVPTLYQFLLETHFFADWFILPEG